MLMKIHMALQQLTSNAHQSNVMKCFQMQNFKCVFSIRLNFIDLKNHSGRDTISSKWSKDQIWAEWSHMQIGN